MKRGQIWGMDLVIAMSIFSLGVVIFYFYSVNLHAESKEVFETLMYEGNGIIESLFSNGYPENWDEADVVTIGIFSDGKINLCPKKTRSEAVKKPSRRRLSKQPPPTAFLD